MNKILVTLAALLATAGCGHQATQTDQSAAAAPARPNLSETQIARIAAQCLHWPSSVVSRIQIAPRVTPSSEPAPYLNFPDGRTVGVSVNGTCGGIAPTRVVSVTPMHHLGPASIVADGEELTSHIWLVIVGAPDADGNRAVMALEGTPMVNMPFEFPYGRHSPEPQEDSEPSPTPVA